MSKPKDLVSEKDYDKKKAKIISQTTGKPIAIDYGKYGRENFVMKDTAKNGFIINKASPKVIGINGNTATNHELAHVLFHSFNERAEKTLSIWANEFSTDGDDKSKRKAIALEIYHEAMNVIEDQRIESLWGKIYLGNVTDFVRCRKNLGKRLEWLDSPAGVLLAERFYRDDLVASSKFKELVPYIHDVEGKGSIQATMMVMYKIKPYLDKEIEKALDNKSPDGEYLPPKVITKEGDNKGMLNDEHRNDQIRRENNQKHKDHEFTKRREAISERRGLEGKRPVSPDVKPYSLDKLQKDYAEVMQEFEEEGMRKVSQIRQKMSEVGEVAVTKPETIKTTLKREIPKEYRLDSKWIAHTQRAIRQLKYKDVEILSDQGDDIDIASYIDLKATGDGECLVDQRRDTGLDICLSVDGSGSMARHNPIVQSIVGTLMEATKNVQNINVKCMQWGSNRQGKVHAIEYNNTDEVRYIPNNTYGFTPTHIGVQHGAELMQGNNRKKLLIVITDGVPYYKQNGKKISDTKMKELLSRSFKQALDVTPNILVIGIGYWQSPMLSQVFRNRLVMCRDVTQVEKLLMAKLQKEIMEVIKQ